MKEKYMLTALTRRKIQEAQWLHHLGVFHVGYKNVSDSVDCIFPVTRELTIWTPHAVFKAQEAMS